jgi:hypothetical protein
MFPHLEARVGVGCGIPHSKNSLSLLMVQYSKDTDILKNVTIKNHTYTLDASVNCPHSQPQLETVIYFLSEEGNKSTMVGDVAAQEEVAG